MRYFVPSVGLGRRLLVLAAMLAIVLPALAGPCCCGDEAPKPADNMAADHSCCPKSGTTSTHRLVPAACDCEPALADDHADVALFGQRHAHDFDFVISLNDDTVAVSLDEHDLLDARSSDPPPGGDHADTLPARGPPAA
ncbi:MAG: hypothetical protein OEV00_03840 [Acidobacteriota bacterium]|nr:hypothetical protein [Acidobacteriota bacterium]MDH3784443.1 hypothetical protein [Acidobacteriota bacterium]